VNNENMGLKNVNFSGNNVVANNLNNVNLFLKIVKIRFIKRVVLC
jgi:hypothetical protein